MEDQLFHEPKSLDQVADTLKKTAFQDNSEDLFSPTPSANVDIEDIAGGSSSATGGNAIATSNKRKRSEGTNDDEMSKSWRDILGPPPPMGTTKV